MYYVHIILYVRTRYTCGYCDACAGWVRARYTCLYVDLHVKVAVKLMKK